MKNKGKLAILLAFVLSLGALFVAPAVSGAATPHGCAFDAPGCGDLIVTAQTSTSVTVTWTNASAISVSRDGVDANGTGPFTEPLSGFPSTGSFTFLNLLPGTTYTFSLQWTDLACGCSGGGQVAPYTTAATTPLGTPTFEATSVGTTAVTVGWTNAVPATVSRDGFDSTGAGPFTSGFIGSPTTGSFTFDKLIPGTTYTFSFSYDCHSGGCPPPLTATATTVALPAPPPVSTPAPPPPPPAPPAPPVAPTPPTPQPHGYWLVGSDGGIFSYGAAQFYGSTGALRLNRPVVGIVPTTTRAGYWLDASDGGIFSFGDAPFFGSIPGLGIAPAGSGLPHSLSAPIVGMVPTADGGGYFMVGADGGVFTFGDAHFEGSCPALGGCAGGAAVSVIPDSTGHGYWLVTVNGQVTPFGDAPNLGGVNAAPVVSAARSADGNGYYLVFANGVVYAFGDAVNYGSANSQVGGFNPAATIFTTVDGGGYWVVSSNGSVVTFGDAPYDGGANNLHLNGSIIAGTGW